jgi:tetratricopeptide (TPR) repeat protein
MSEERKERNRAYVAEADEMVTAGQRLAVWAGRNASLLVYAGGALLFIALVAAGFILVRGNRVTLANLALAEAVNQLQPAATGNDAAPAGTGIIVLDRNLQALASLREVERRFSSMPQGKVAVIYAANLLFSMGSYRQSAAVLEGLSTRDPRFALRFGGSYLLAKSYEATGDYDRALAVYSQVRDRSTGEMRGRIMVDMARCSQLAGDGSRAVEFYRKVKDEFPADSPLGQRADKMLVLLGASAKP